jgi:hypothetical protein
LAVKRRFTKRCARLCVEQRDDRQLEAVFESAQSNMQWIGVNAVLDGCMEAGPASHVGRRWAERIIERDAGESVTSSERATELRAWLLIEPEDAVVVPK